MPAAILFDLDGTLVDTRSASWALFAETNRAFGLGVDSRDDFFRAFEGNFFESLSRLVPDPARAAAARDHFLGLLRARYNPEWIPGMIDVVQALSPHCVLAVISTNTIETIRRILVDAGVATCFSHVFAGDIQPSKATSIRRFLGDRGYRTQRLCSPAYAESAATAEALAGSDVVLVTDTVGDVREAREAGVRAIGVSWGMHAEQQLLEAGADRVALWPQELIAWLLDAPAGGPARSTTAAPASASAIAVPASPVPASPVAASPVAGTAACGCAPASGACTMATAPSVDPVLAAGVRRREQRLAARSTAQATAPAARRPPRVDPEFIAALRRIAGQGP